MKKYKLHTEQIIHASLEEVWDFFSSPENLDNLTPGNMAFEITSQKPVPKMFEGQMIEYKVAPVLNIPLHWKTLISEVKDKEYFVDEQLEGPYKFWRHKHIFKSLGINTVKMNDELEYALPLGPLGTIAHTLYVKNRLKEIFDYRYQKVDQLFNHFDISKRVDNTEKALSVQ